MTITSWDGLVSAWTGGSGSAGTRYGQRIYFHKANINLGAAYTPHSWWKSEGFPGTGSYGSFGLSNGRTCTRSAGIGGIPFYPAPAGKTNWLIAGGVGNQSVLTNVWIVDRICDVFCSASGSGNFSGMDATSRLAPGEGAQIWIEVVNSLSAVTTTLNITYVNQDGQTKTTPNFTYLASSGASRGPVSSRLWVPLAAGDRGVRSLTSITVVSGAPTGDVAICLVKPLVAMLSMSGCIAIDNDFILSMPQVVKLYDEACLFGIWFNSTMAITTTFMGELKAIAQ